MLHAGTASLTSDAIGLEEEHAAHNYHPLPVVVAHGEGAWVTDVEGRRYLDCLAAYSAVNFGHGNANGIRYLSGQGHRVPACRGPRWRPTQNKTEDE